MGKAQSEWAPSLCLAQMVDGSFKFPVNYPKFKAFTVNGINQIPWMDECIGSLCKARVLSILEAILGNWQIGIDKCDRGNPHLYRIM